jgi:hypothetical protein
MAVAAADGNGTNPPSAGSGPRQARDLAAWLAFTFALPRNLIQILFSTTCAHSFAAKSRHPAVVVLVAQVSRVGSVMYSKDIAWLAIASVLGLKLVSGLAVAGDHEQPAAPAWGLSGNLYGAHARFDPTTGAKRDPVGRHRYNSADNFKVSSIPGVS